MFKDTDFQYLSNQPKLIADNLNKALVKAEPLLLDVNAELTLKAIKIPAVK